MHGKNFPQHIQFQDIAPDNNRTDLQEIKANKKQPNSAIIYRADKGENMPEENYNDSAKRKEEMRQKLDEIRNSSTENKIKTGTTLWNYLSDPNVPLIQKILPFAALIYIFCPIDLLPDFIPILGYADDFVVFLVGALKLYSNFKKYKGIK